jgi:hypothetical protein
MAKCQKCGRKGLFFKVNSDGLCSDCVALTAIEKEKDSLDVQISQAKDELSQIRQKISNEDAELKRLETERQETYNTIKRQAESAAIANVQSQIDDLEQERVRKSVELQGVTLELDKLRSDSDSLLKKYVKMKTLFESYQSANKRYIKEGEVSLDDSFLNNLTPTVEIELQCMSVKQLRSLYNQNKKLISDCLKRYEDRYTTKTNAALYKLMTIALEAELQNILYSLSFGKLESSIDTVKTMSAKYLAIASDGNQSIAPTIKKFIGEIEYLYIEAVKIEYEYYVQKERIKEEQRAIKEQMRQEAEERKALEQERKRIEREEQKYRNEIDNIRVQLETAEPEKAEVLSARISELESQIGEIEDKREQIASLENGKAGYVYIISNIGSFGDDVYKIGMTRRMEPMDRINELGSASVPFPFDVHGLVFSDDAVSLEHDLHTIFNNQRVNKVNLRKEFFKVSLDDIEKVVDERCPSAEFKRTALAEQYRQSISMSETAAELDDEDLSENFA